MLFFGFTHTLPLSLTIVVLSGFKSKLCFLAIVVVGTWRIKMLTLVGFKSKLCFLAIVVVGAWRIKTLTLVANE